MVVGDEAGDGGDGDGGNEFEDSSPRGHRFTTKELVEPRKMRRPIVAYKLVDQILKRSPYIEER